jgi:hydroxymethylbilane synthase
MHLQVPLLTGIELRVGTRASALALAQTDIVIASLHDAARRSGVELRTEVIHIRTTGDAVTDRPFEAIGPKGVFAVELQQALIGDRIDVAVHSLKDLTSAEPDGLVLAAVCERGDPHDVLVSRDGATLEALPAGAVVGTSSSRRRALVAIDRPDLTTAPLRGNVDTRLEKVARGDVDAAILAASGIVRLGRAEAITQWLDPQRFVPPPGQGALAVECRSDRFASDLGWLQEAEHAPTRACVDAERAFMEIVEGGCEVPLGAWARFDDDELVCEGFIASAVQRGVPRFVRDVARGVEPAEVGADLARRMLAAGAGDL